MKDEEDLRLIAQEEVSDEASDDDEDDDDEEGLELSLVDAIDQIKEELSIHSELLDEMLTLGRERLEEDKRFHAELIEVLRKQQ